MTPEVVVSRHHREVIVGHEETAEIEGNLVWVELRVNTRYRTLVPTRQTVTPSRCKSPALPGRGLHWVAMRTNVQAAAQNCKVRIVSKSMIRGRGTIHIIYGDLSYQRHVYACIWVCICMYICMRRIQLSYIYIYTLYSTQCIYNTIYKCLRVMIQVYGSATL